MRLKAGEMARLRRVGREGYQVSRQSQVALPRELDLEGCIVEQIIVEKAGVVRVKKGDVILRRKEVPLPIPDPV